MILVPVFHHIEYIDLAGAERVPAYDRGQTLAGQLHESILLDELRAVFVYKTSACLFQVPQLVQARYVVDAAHVFNVQNGLEIVRGGLLELDEAVLVHLKV